MSAFKGPKLRLGFASNSRVIHFQSINFNQTPICRNLISFLKKDDVSYNKLRCQNILYRSFPQDPGMGEEADESFPLFFSLVLLYECKVPLMTTTPARAIPIYRFPCPGSRVFSSGKTESIPQLTGSRINSETA